MEENLKPLLRSLQGLPLIALQSTICRMKVLGNFQTIWIHVRWTIGKDEERSKDFGLQEQEIQIQGQDGEDGSSLTVSESRSEVWRLEIRRNQPGMLFEGAEEADIERLCSRDDQAEAERIATQTDISTQYNY